MLSVCGDGSWNSQVKKGYMVKPTKFSRSMFLCPLICWNWVFTEVLPKVQMDPSIIWPFTSTTYPERLIKTIPWLLMTFRLLTSRLSGVVMKISHLPIGQISKSKISAWESEWKSDFIHDHDFDQSTVNYFVSNVNIHFKLFVLKIILNQFPKIRHT